MPTMLRSANLEPVEVESEKKLHRYPVIWDVRGKAASVSDLHFHLDCAASRHGVKPLSLRQVQNYVSLAHDAVNRLDADELAKTCRQYGFDPVAIKRVDQCGRAPYYSRELMALALMMQNFLIVSPNSL